MNALPEYRDPTYLATIEGTDRDLIAVVESTGKITVQQDRNNAPTIGRGHVTVSQIAIAGCIDKALAALGFVRISQSDRHCGPVVVAAVARVRPEHTTKD